MNSIFVQDNFFEDDIFQKIKLEIPTVDTETIIEEGSNCIESGCKWYEVDK